MSRFRFMLPKTSPIEDQNAIFEALPQKQETCDVLGKIEFFVVKSTLSALIWYYNQVIPNLLYSLRYDHMCMRPYDISI